MEMSTTQTRRFYSGVGQDHWSLRSMIDFDWSFLISPPKNDWFWLFFFRFFLLIDLDWFFFCKLIDLFFKINDLKKIIDLKDQWSLRSLILIDLFFKSLILPHPWWLHDVVTWNGYMRSRHEMVTWNRSVHEG